MSNTSYATLTALKAALHKGKTTVRQRVEAHLAAIEARNEELNLFLEVYADEALRTADLVDAKLANGAAGALAGLVLGVKDNIVWEGHSFSASSKLLEGFTSLFTATALQRLLNEDALVIGRLNCDEFAMGSSNENSAFGLARLPQDPDRVPGGSSGGSAAAVAAGMCQVALGSDTGGSIRQPASFTGTYGFKPTYGRISRNGLIAYASSFDQIGPIAASLEDAARVTQMMAGLDPADATTTSHPVGDWVAASHTRHSGARIGVLRPCLEMNGLSPEVGQLTRQLLEKLTAAGHTVEEVDYPLFDVGVPTYHILSTAEASSNLARYDGVRVGHRAPAATSNEALFVESRSQGFGPEVQRRIMLGTFVLSAGYYDAYYTKAMKVRRLIRNATDALLQDYDVLLSPTTPTPAFVIGAKTKDPISMYLSDVYTVQANLAGNPAISLPLLTAESGLPVGIHLMGGRYQEDLLLSLSHEIEQVARM